MPPVNMRDPASGEVYAVDESEVAARASEGWKAETIEDQVDRVTADRRAEEYGGISGAIAAGGAAGLRGISAGGSDLVFGGLGVGDEFRDLRDEHAGLSTVGEIGGAVLGAALSGGSSLAATPAGLAARAGASIARAGEGASLLARGARLAAGGAVEGGIDAVGQAITQKALYNDLDVENFGSLLLSNMALGAGGNLAATGAGKALRAAKGKLDDVVARGTSKADGAIADDLATLDSKGLRQAEKAELEVIEQSRVGQRAQVADEIKAHRATAKDEKLFLATKDAKTWEGIDEALRKDVREVGKVSLEADKAIDRALRNPKALASNPRRALDALQQQESALEGLLAKRAQLEDVFKADATKARVQALDGAERALQRNKEIQSKLAELGTAPTSQRLDDIVSARDALQTGGKKESFLGKAAAGAAFAGASGLAYESGLPGSSYLAPLIGAAAANAVSGKLGAKLSAASMEAAKRTSKAIDMFLDVGKRVAPAAPVLATRVYQGVRYATGEDERKEPKGKTKAPKSKPSLAELHKTRTDEIRQQTAYVNGTPKMRPAVRQAIAAKLSPIGMSDPMLADRLETLAARKMEYLARKIPRRPDIAAVQAGPDAWQPSDMEMRSFARTVAAVEDPHAVIERMVDGTITPEDAEALREVYPEMMSDVTQQILERLPELQQNLPYERRLALSIFSGAPVDPAMDPRVLSVLQGSFTNEPGTEGGMQAPRPQPAFGSVKAQDPTPAQQRSA